MTDATQQQAAPRQAARLSFDQWFRRFDPDRGHIERLIFLSDGVFAIALTLLAIEIRPPEHWDGTVAGLGRELYAGVAAYVVSFVILGAGWAQQRRALAMLATIDAMATGLALLFLAFVGLVPAAVSFQVHYSSLPLSFLIYGGVIFAMLAARTAFWIYVANIRRLVREDLPARYRFGATAMQVLSLGALACLMAALAPATGDVRADEIGRGWFAGAVALAVASIIARRWHRRPEAA